MVQVTARNLGTLQPKNIALLVLIRLSFLTITKSASPPADPGVALCSFILSRLWDDPAQDKTLEQFLQGLLDCARDCDEAQVQEVTQKHASILEFFKTLSSKRKPDALLSLFKDLKRRLCTEREEEDKPFDQELHNQYPIDRHSPIGVFFRRKAMDFNYTSYFDLLTLVDHCLLWCTTGLASIDDTDMSEPIASTSKCALHAQSGRGLAYDEFHRSRANGHSLRAHRALQQFFDYRFHDKSDRLHYLHALLNLAALHAEERGWEQARAALLEAVMLAKASGDKGTITSCIALMRRIDFNDPDGRLDDSSFELPDASTLATSQDQLWQVKEALKLGRPVNLAFASLYRAKVTLLSETIGPRLDRQKARWECVCSELWELLGSPALAIVHRNMALDSRTDWKADPSGSGSRYIAIASKAHRLAIRGEFEKALLLVLSYTSADKFRMVKSDFSILQAAIHDVFLTHAQLQHYEEAINSYINPMNAARVTSSVKVSPTDVEARVRQLLTEARALLSGGSQATADALHKVLEALLLSDLHEPPDQALGHNPPPEHSRTLPLLHLRAQLLLADIQLAYSASSAARQVYQQIESKVRSLEDPTLLTELYALDSKLRRAEGDPQGALDSLRGAIDISRTSSARVRELELLGDLARLAHDQNDFKTRDAATRRWHELGDYERLRTDEQYFISIIQRVQAWMISQDARLCVEPSACSDVYADMKRATFEWIGPEADEDPKIP